MKPLLAALVIAPALFPQSVQVQVQVYSEFQRIDPFGRIVAADRSARPREILSPEVARNAHASFHVAVTAPRNESYFLYVQTFPPNIFQTILYEERFVKHGSAWIPDALKEMRAPYFGVMPDPAAGVAGQTTNVYLLDVWVPPETTIGAARLEVLVKSGYWRVAPMEIRVLPARVRAPLEYRFHDPLPPVEEPVDASAVRPLAEFLEGVEPSAAGPPLTVRAVVRRNAARDMALARQLDPRIARAEIMRRLWSELGGTWRPIAPPGSGAEWYLRVRDFIYRAAPPD
ncbi:MAG: hypothetical protein ACREMQ_00200 [Longimicrobiales bacterium]